MPRHRARADERDLNEPAVVPAGLGRHFFGGSTATATASVYSASIWWMVRSKLKIFLNPSGLRSSTPCSVDWILETHAHADHLSGARDLQERVGGRIAISENIRAVQETFKKIFNLERTFLPDGSQFDHLFKDGETFKIGDVQATALLVPGHTPADMAYLVEGSVFVGDTLFMPDVGSARADFPGGNAHQLYQSMRRLLALPPETTMYVCHDYPPANREAQWVTTVAEQRRRNIHVRDGITEDQFVALRKARDSTLEVPTLILPSIQVNIRAGHLPPADDNGVAYLRIPLNTLPAPK